MSRANASYEIGGNLYYTISEAARRLNLPRKTIEERFKNGNIYGGIPRTCFQKNGGHPNLVPATYIQIENARMEQRSTISHFEDFARRILEQSENLTVPEKIEMVRAKSGLLQKDIALKIGVSPALMDILEEGGVTHPKIAKKIGKVYGLSFDEIESIIPKNYRKHGGDYDPNRYKSPEDIYGFLRRM